MKAYTSHYQEHRSITKGQVPAASARHQPISQSQDRLSVCTVTKLSAITRATMTVRAASSSFGIHNIIVITAHFYIII